MTFRQTCRILLLAVAVAFVGSPGSAGNEPAVEADGPILKVATRSSPPFAMRSDDGQWSGIAIALMLNIAHDLGRSIAWVPVETTNEIVQAVATGQADAGIAAVSVTVEREKIIDFSHPYYDTGLAIAIAVTPGSNLRAIVQALTSSEFLITIGALVVLLAVMGILIWLVERRRNADQFHARPIQGIGNGFWWAAVTMATVGYGDKAPVTLLGRTIAIVWMFAALILMAVFTAHLTSSLTLRGISGAVTDINDLPRARVGIVGNSASASFFEKRFIRTQSFPDVAAGLEALASDKIDAFVHDEPILRYHIARSHHGVIELLPKLFEAADYAVVLPTGSPLREPINESILNSIESSDWAVLLAKYLGPGD